MTKRVCISHWTVVSYPRSDNLHALRKHIKTISEKSKPYSLSQEMSVLLGLLEKDFQNVTACTAHVLVDHIKKVCQDL